MEWFCKVMRARELTHAEAHVLAFIFAHVGGGKGGSGTAWPSLRTIAEGTGSSRRTVQRAVDRFIQLGFAAVTPGGGRRRSNTYQMTLPKGLAGRKGDNTDRQSCD